MPLNKRRHSTILVTYLLAELVLLIAAKFCEHLSLNCEGAVKYAAVVCNAAFAFYYFLKYGRGRAGIHENLIAYGIFLTVIADFFLTLISRESFYVPGIVAFCAVQLLYMLYLKPNRNLIVLMTVLYAASLLAIYKAGLLETASALGALDLVLILGNTISAWFSNKSNPSLLFKLGITLFLGCDMSIFLSLALSGGPGRAFAWMVWVFYAPSQVFITLSYMRAVLDCSE